MSQEKGRNQNGMLFLKQPEGRSPQDIPIRAGLPTRQTSVAGLALRIVTILAVVVALAVGGGLAVAQDQAPAAPSQPSGGSQSSSPPQSQENPVPAEPAPVPHPRATSRSVLSEHMSSDLSAYLHQHHLPFVDAMVFTSASGRPTSVKLSGQVRTEHGKEDAAIKSSDFLNAPGVRIQNHIEVDAGLASTAPASSSGSVVPASSSASAVSASAAGAPAAAADPCSDLCLKDEGHCNTACQTQAAGGASGGGLSIQGIMGQFGQSATALKQCTDQCVQTREHCTYDCTQARSSAPPSEGTDSGGPPSARDSDHQAAGPDTPPE
jgi:hypothetical protein